MYTDLQNIDFKSLTPQQLKELSAKIDEARAEAERENREKTKRDVLALIKDRGFHSIEELFSSAPRGRRGRGEVAPKFRNPADPAQTWAGRGKRPRWFADALAAGATEDSMRV